MDPVTHAASGAVAMLALPRHPRTIWAVPLAALVTASPDIDLLFIHTPLEFLLLHRGITHSFSGVPFLALICALACRPLWKASTQGRWSFAGVWLFCCALVLLHIWLDVVTTYGTMVFLPFSHYRVRLNSVFIIDLLLALPLVWALVRFRKRAVAVCASIWMFSYPGLGVALNSWHTEQMQERLAADGRNIVRLVILPDAFAPFFWRAIYEEQLYAANGAKWIVHEQSLDVLGRPRAPATTYDGAPPHVVRAYSTASATASAYFQFALSPVVEKLPGRYLPGGDNDAGMDYRLFYDLRFGSGLEFVRLLMSMRPNADIPFLFMAESPAGTPDELTRLRLRFSDSGRDSDWHAPVPLRKPGLARWLVGLY